MTENQKLREALQAISHIDDSTNHAVDASAALDRIGRIARQALALPTADHIPDAGEMVVDHLPDAGKMIETAAPDMPLSMNQFGRLVELTREHLTDNTFVYKATSKAGDTCHFGVESAAKAWAKGGTVEAIKVREFKLHTSSPTAAPVGEREAFGYFYIVNGVHEGFCKGVEPPPDDSYDEGTLVPVYRSALSAGDAVDAQRYRWLREQHWSNSAICCVYKPKQNVRLGGTCPSGDLLDSAIDAAMRKGQL